MNTASWIALSTKNPSAIFGLFGSMSTSFRAARIVAAKQNGELSFLGHVGTPAFWNEIQAREARTAVYFFLFHKPMKSLTVAGPCPALLAYAIWMASRGDRN